MDWGAEKTTDLFSIETLSDRENPSNNKHL